MVRGRRLRRAYNAVNGQEEEEDGRNAASGAAAAADAGEDVFVDEEQGGVSATPPSSSSRLQSGRRRRQYQTVNTNGDEDLEKDDDTVEEDMDGSDDDDDDDDAGGDEVTLVILDPAQKKFPVKAFTHWTIAKFKAKGQKVHKVPPASQRLIYRGQLLQDHKTLEAAGLVHNEMIVHLFPKPRVVIQQQQANGTNAGACATNGGDNNNSDNNNDSPGGAHIPQIVLNPDEANNRASILVLGSPDFLEAQNNVKLFAFLLMVISSIELFNLILILMGVPPDNNTNASRNDGHGNNPYASTSNDDVFHFGGYNRTDQDPYGYNNNNNDPYAHADPYEQAQIQAEMSQWHPRNNVDMAISALGVYVAMLGIRATNETTLLLARQYLVGTVIVGISWMLFNYWFTVHVDEEFDQLRRDERHNHTFPPGTGLTNGTAPPNIYDDDVIPYKSDFAYYQQNLSLMMIPAMVWILCCVRAWQFQALLEDAEREAEERIRNELAQHGFTPNGEPMAAGGATPAEATDVEGGGTGRRTPRRGRGRSSQQETDLEVQNDTALELQNNTAEMT